MNCLPITRTTFLLLAFLVGPALLAGSCGDGGGTVRIAVAGPDGQAPEGLVAAATFEDGTTEVVACGNLAPLADSGDGDTTPRAWCGAGDGAVELEAGTGEVRLVLKARGFRTSEIRLPGSVEAGHALTVQLPSLLPPVVNDDYATALTEEGAEEVFDTLGFQADTELGPALALKFYIDDIQGTPRVYFQNTHKYSLHYEFVYHVLGRKITRQQFDQETYEGADRTGMAGTIVWYPYLTCPSEDLDGSLVSPMTLNFFPSDDLTPTQVLRAHRVLEERIELAGLAGGQRRLVYLPAGTIQEEALAPARESFEAQDTLWILRPELFGDLTIQTLNPGLAFGTLRRMDPEELATTPVSFTDILVLTRLPNELPIVGGTITEELQTPLAHVNLAARTRGTPNLAFLAASEDPRIEPWLGKLVRFEVAHGTFTVGPTTLAEAQAYWDSLKKEPIIPFADLSQKGLPAFSELGFNDAPSFGVKAANLAELSQLLPENTPDGFGVPFYYYDLFMRTARLTPALCDEAQADCLKEGRSEAVCAGARALCEPSSPAGEPFYGTVDRLLADPGFRSDTALREAALDGLRHAMRNSPVNPLFAFWLDARVTELFGAEKVRLRSSTNCEDLPDFSGAGLYTSVGAYGTGPDRASNEIRKVWASVWNFKAFEERSFWNLDHRGVRMGVLVSRAFPDEEANGVLVTRNISEAATYGMYVNVQVGEEAVTNPEGGLMPEILTIVPAPGWAGVQVNRQRFSSLSPAEPILSLAECGKLFSLSYKAMFHFAKLYGEDPMQFPFDIEFKLVGPERRLVLKQIRPYSVTKTE
jgi:hypothetical protein